MPTRFYLTTNSNTYLPATMKGAWDDTASVRSRLLSTAPTIDGFGQIGVFVNGAAGLDGLCYRGISAGLGAQTIAGNFNVTIGVKQNSAADDMAYHLHLYVTQGDSDLVRGTLLSNYVETVANEFPTSAAGRALAAPVALTSVTATAGDRIVVEVGFVKTTGPSSGIGTVYYGSFPGAPDLTVGASPLTANGWIEFATSLASQDARVSQVLLEGALQQVAAQDARVSQVVMEGAFDQSAAQDARVSQVAVEVAISSYDPTPVAASKRSQVIIVG